jgi:hypothetical protein
LYVWGVKLEAKPAVISLFLLAKFGRKEKFKIQKSCDFRFFFNCPDVRKKKVVKIARFIYLPFNV